MKQLFSGMALMASIVLFTLSPAWSSEQEAITPEQVPGVQTVNAEQVKELADAGVPIIDVRPQRAYDKAKLPGASLLVYDEKSLKAAEFDASQDAFDLKQLPADKNAKVVFYCNGATCWRSYKASRVAADAGYTNIKFFRGGLPEWKEKGLPVE